jgi:hypothetical protein
MPGAFNPQGQGQAFGQLDPAAKMKLLRMLRQFGVGAENATPQHPAGRNTQQLMANQAAQQQAQGGGAPGQEGPTGAEGGMANQLVESIADKIVQMLGLGVVEQQQRGKEALSEGVVDVATPVPGVNQ